MFELVVVVFILFILYIPIIFWILCFASFTRPSSNAMSLNCHTAIMQSAIHLEGRGMVSALAKVSKTIPRTAWKLKYQHLSFSIEGNVAVSVRFSSFSPSLQSGKSAVLDLMKEKYPYIVVVWQPVTLWTSFGSSAINALEMCIKQPKVYSGVFNCLTSVSMKNEIEKGRALLAESQDRASFMITETSMASKWLVVHYFDCIWKPLTRYSPLRVAKPSRWHP